MNEHDVLKSLLADLVAGSLNHEDQAGIRRHLDLCARCSLNARILRQVVQAAQRPQGDASGPKYLAHISELANAHRMKVIANRRQAAFAAAVSLLGWALVIMTLPLWQWLAGILRQWSGWQVFGGPLSAFALGALLSYLFVPGLWLLLEPYRVTRSEEGRP
jgi:hypothetical protein